MLSMTTTKQYEPVQPTDHLPFPSCLGLGHSLGLVSVGHKVECPRCIALCERIKVKA